MPPIHGGRQCLPHQVDSPIIADEDSPYPMDPPPGEVYAADTTPAEFFCPECGYDLRAITSQRCPECGLAIDRASMSVSRLPWSHRHKIGRVRAYWRTMLLRPRKLAEEMARPVSFSDAQQFRHVTVFLAWLPLAAWAVGLALYNTPDLRHRIHAGTRLGWFLEAVVLLSGLFALWLFLLMASGVASYFFHPRRLPVVLQNRAVALSYYASGPLALLWIPGVFGAVYALLESQQWGGQSVVERYDGVFFGAALLLPIVLAIVCLVRAVLLMLSTIHCGAGRVMAMIVCLPVAWFLSLLIALMIPAIATYISFVILSTR
jgi:predicted RNA-binding Zn-ribbon protein involved in translation (DUF1610 family)